jgi:predicted DNA binding protein
MTVTAEVHLGSPSLPLVSIAKLLQPDGIQCPHVLGLQQGRQLFVVEIDTAKTLSEEKLLALDEVVEATKLGSAREKEVYKLTVVLEESVAKAFDDTPDAGLVDAVTITPEGWYEKKVFKDYPALQKFQNSCENNGILAEITSIMHDASTFEESSPYGLTERQHEALTLALSRGYYERPRQTTAEELADELGISQPSFSDLLGRGERQLISTTLGPPARLEIVSK